MHSHWGRSALLGILWISLASCNAGNQTLSDVAVPAPPSATTEVYRIGQGDLLTISVFGNPDLTVTVPVRPDGYVSMPLLGDIKAEDKDAATLSAEINEQLSDQLRNPQATVIVAQVNSVQYITRVRITGAVRAPRSLPYARGMSVLDAILEAGGVNEVAAANRARLYRTVEGELQEYEIRLDDILLRGKLETNYEMQPGDVITVPERLF